MKTFQGILLVAIIFAGLWFLGWLFWGLGVATSTTRGVVERTVNPDNVLQNYEYYFDASEQYTALRQQVADFQRAYNSEQDAGERSYLRNELFGTRQVCRNLAAEYNSNSQKLNRRLFKDSNLPYRLEPTCE